MRLQKCPILLAVLPIAAILLCIWSFVSHDRLVWTVGSDSWGFVNCNGRLQLRIIQRTMPAGYKRLRGFWAGDERGNWENDGVPLTSLGTPALGWHYGGVSYQGSSFGTPPPRFSFMYSAFSVSHGLIVALTLLPAAVVLYRKRQMKSEAD